MNARRDALAAAAKLALEIRTIARKHPDAVCTMGSLKTFPGIVTAVVGRCETALDQRDLDLGILAQMYREAQEASQRFAHERKTVLSNGPACGTFSPFPFIQNCWICANNRCARCPGASHRMPSGPLHDAAEVARAGIPAVMLFVQSLKGISHNKIEDTREGYLEMSVTALDRLATKTVEWILR